MSLELYFAVAVTVAAVSCFARALWLRRKERLVREEAERRELSRLAVARLKEFAW
jgi:hypothetical protein